MTAYFDELDARFPAGFDPGDTLEADAHQLEAPGGCFVIAYLDGEPVGCVGLQTIDPGVGEVKRMWVSPTARGRGVGAGLLAEVERRAAAAGLGTLRLDTDRILTEAVALYRRSGYREIGRYNDNPYPDLFFEKRLTDPEPGG